MSKKDSSSSKMTKVGLRALRKLRIQPANHPAKLKLYSSSRLVVAFDLALCNVFVMAQANRFTRLRVYNWRQFANVEIDFHQQLTVITGANGAGKSSLLNILARHMGSERPYLSVPKRDAKGISYVVGRLSSFWTSLFGSNVERPASQIGEISYLNDVIAPITVPDGVGAAYQIQIANQQPMAGVAVGSHRLLSGYQPISSIPFAGIAPAQFFPRLVNEANHRYVGSFSGNSLIFQIKETVASWAAVGEGNSTIQADAKQRDAFEGFIKMLRVVLPESLGFQNLSIRPPDVVLSTTSGEFTIDAASGGLTSVIEIASLIYACSLQANLAGDVPFVVTIDEPENHLHPSLQRSLFPNLVKAFPQVQFIVATHSPFIVSSLKDSSVYVLRYHQHPSSDTTDSRRIVSEKLDYSSRAGNASEILREVLGLETTLPKWVELDLQTLVKKYQSSDINSETLNQLRRELEVAGLSELFPEALAGLSKGK